MPETHARDGEEVHVPASATRSESWPMAVYRRRGKLFRISMSKMPETNRNISRMPNCVHEISSRTQ